MIGVLRPGRVRLEAAERPELREQRGIELAQQVLQRVVRGRRVRLHRDEVPGAQPAQVDRGEDRDHRGARRLMAADLQAIAIRADVVRLVDHPGREPQDPLLDPLERGLVVGGCPGGARTAFRRGSMPVRGDPVPVGDGQRSSLLRRVVPISGTPVPEFVTVMVACTSRPGQRTRRLRRTTAHVARWRVGRGCSTPSRSAANGASATSPGRRRSRAARCIGWSPR